MRHESHTLLKNSHPAIQESIHNIISFIQESYDYTDTMETPEYTDAQFSTLQTTVSDSMGILGPLCINSLLHNYKKLHPATTLHYLPITKEHMTIIRDVMFQLLSTSIFHLSKSDSHITFDTTSALHIESIYWCMKKLARYQKITVALCTVQMRQDIVSKLERLRNMLIILRMACDLKNPIEADALIRIKHTQKTLQKARSIAEQLILTRSTRALSDKSNTSDTSDDEQSNTLHP